MKENDDEATGKEYFHLSKIWSNIKDPIFLMNQHFDNGKGFPDGTVSVFLGKNYKKNKNNNKEGSGINETLMKALNEYQIELIDWEKAESILQEALDGKDNSKINEDKHQRMEFLFRIVGLDFRKYNLLKNNPDFHKYALTFDNVCQSFFFSFIFVCFV